MLPKVYQDRQDATAGTESYLRSFADQKRQANEHLSQLSYGAGFVVVDR